MRCGLDPTPRRPTVFSTRAALAAGVCPERLRRSDLQAVRRGLWRVRDAAADTGDVLRALQDLYPTGAWPPCARACSSAAAPAASGP